MKMKVLVIAIMVFLGLGVGSIQAQDWSWENPILLSDLFVEIAADPSTGKVFGLKADGSIVEITLTYSDTGLLSTLAESAVDPACCQEPTGGSIRFFWERH